MKYQVIVERTACQARPYGNSTRYRGDACVHERGTVGAIKELYQRMICGNRHPGGTVQYLSSPCAHRRQAHKGIWRTAQVYELGPPYPHGFRRVPGIFPWQDCARLRKKEFTLIPISTATRYSWGLRRACRFSPIWVPPLPWRLTNVLPSHASDDYIRHSVGAHHPMAGALQDRDGAS